MGEGPKVSLSPKVGGGKSLVGVPGPGTYNPKKEAILEKKPSIGMSQAARGSHKKELVPGPGNYTTSELKMKGPSYSIGTGPRSSLIKAKDGPGPGNYNISSNELPSYEKAKMKAN